MARNVSTGGKDSRTVSAVLGWQDLKKKVAKLKDAAVSEEAQVIVGNAATYVTSEVRHSAETVNVPHEVYKNIFTYSKPSKTPSGKTARVSALSGIRKRGRARPFAVSYAEWSNRAAYTRLRWKSIRKGKRFGPKLAASGGEVGAGQKVGENLATMWEIGTSKRPATPFFRPAIEKARGRAMTMLADGYRALILKYGGGA